MSRKVIVYSTLGDNMREIYSSARTWGELQRDLGNNGINYEGMRAMEGADQVSFESAAAKLPEGEFSLFLMPQKVKSGWEVSDEDYIDEEDGITWEEADWNSDSENIEDYTFASYKDLAIARAKKAVSLLNKAINTLANGRSIKLSSNSEAAEDPTLVALREQARQIQNNINMFG